MFSKLTVDGEHGGEEWPLFDKENAKYLSIGSSSPVVAEKPFAEEYEFWNSLPLISGVKIAKEVYQKSEL